MLICAGGAFAAVPPPAAALAVVDGMRRPGALTPVPRPRPAAGAASGALPDEGDRRRLLADLLDDALLPLGSAIVTGDGRVAARAPRRHCASPAASQQHDLELPPATPCGSWTCHRACPPGSSCETRDGPCWAFAPRRIALDVTGGLGGLLVDTRDVPLRLPDRAERRRALLEAWERPVWGADR